jgi:hypothetical protein
VHLYNTARCVGAEPSVSIAASFVDQAGLDTWHPVDPHLPQLETAWFQPMNHL